MFAILNYYSISLFLGGVVALLSGAAVYFSSSKKEEGTAWMLLNLSTAIWSFGYFSMIIASDKQVAVISDQILHYGAILIPLFYLLFILKLVRIFDKYKYVFYSLTLATIFFLYHASSTWYVQDVLAKGPFPFVPDAGPLYIYFTVYFFVVTIFAQLLLLKGIYTQPFGERVRLWWVFFSSIFGFLGGSSVFFLTFNVPIHPYLLPFFAFYPLIITVAILRYKLFNVKIISAELLTGILWVVLLFRTLLSDRLTDQLVNGVVLVLTTIFGILLVKNVQREVEQRERIEKLALELSKANTRLKEIDKQKSEFVSFASHQLRSPLTAIKGYASMILEGDYGAIADGLKDAMEKIYESSKTLANVVDDYLNISRIELGTMKYHFTPLDLRELTENVIGELKPNFEKAGVNLTFASDKAKTYRVNADPDKLKQVIANIIDNSMKYSPNGASKISVLRDDARKIARFEISDNGIGMSTITLEKLFKKFTRAENANQTNIRGTGLGLYVARDIIGAHKGKIWAESEGEGKGSKFIFELALI